MEPYFEPITAENRYKNEMMDHMRRQTIALEQLAQLLQPREAKPEKMETSTRSYQRRKAK